MITFWCLIVRPHKGMTMTKQRELVKSLGGVQIRDTCGWNIQASTIEDVKRIEAALINQVPYNKEMA